MKNEEEIRFLVRSYTLDYDGCETSAADEWLFTDNASAKIVFDALNPRADWMQENKAEWLRFKKQSKKALETRCAEIIKVVYNTEEDDITDYDGTILYKDYGPMEFITDYYGEDED